MPIAPIVTVQKFYSIQKVLGRLANRELRKAKTTAHDYSDKISRIALISKIWKDSLANAKNKMKDYIGLAKN